MLIAIAAKDLSGDSDEVRFVEVGECSDLKRKLDYFGLSNRYEVAENIKVVPTVMENKIAFYDEQIAHLRIVLQNLTDERRQILIDAYPNFRTIDAKFLPKKV